MGGELSARCVARVHRILAGTILRGIAGFGRAQSRGASALVCQRALPEHHLCERGCGRAAPRSSDSSRSRVGYRDARGSSHADAEPDAKPDAAIVGPTFRNTVARGQTDSIACRAITVAEGDVNLRADLGANGFRRESHCEIGRGPRTCLRRWRGRWRCRYP